LEPVVEIMSGLAAAHLKQLVCAVGDIVA